MSLLATQEGAGTKFWRMPELVKKLMEYLDEFSILSIVGVKLLKVEVLDAASKTSKRFESKPLGKLIRKALGFGQGLTFRQQREKVQRISNNLLAQLYSPQPLLLEVLDVICAEHKYVRGTGGSVIRLSCPLHTYHSVSAIGFILLQDCEGAIAMDSTEQRVRKIELHGSIAMPSIDYIWGGIIDYFNPNPYRPTLLFALTSRLARQKEDVETLTWNSDTYHINNPALPFSALLQRCDQLLNLKTVRVRGELGLAGWEALGKAMQRHKCRLLLFTSKEWMLQARRADLRIIWDAMPARPTGSSPSSWAVEGRDMEGRVSIDKRFIKACAGPRAEEKNETTWMQLLEFLDEPETEVAPRRLRSGRELSEG